MKRRALNLMAMAGLCLGGPLGPGVLGQSSPAMAGPAPTCAPYQIWVDMPPVPTVGGTVTVRWIAPPDTGARDWIGLFRPSATNYDHLQWHYVPLAPGQTGGAGDASVSFDILAAGPFEVRYLVDNSFSAAASSAVFDVVEAPAVAGQYRLFDLEVSGGKVQTNWTAPAASDTFWQSSDLDWIGLFRVGAADKDYLDFVFVRRGDGPRTRGSTRDLIDTLDIPGPGHYELRYMLRSVYRRAAISPSFRVGYF